MEDLRANNPEHAFVQWLMQNNSIRGLVCLMVYLSLSTASCAQLPASGQNTYLLIDQTNNSIDTVYRNRQGSPGVLKDGKICYETRYSSETSEQCFFVSENSNGGAAKFVESKTYYFKGEPVRVDKYSYDDPNIADEEQTYFYTEGVGVILIKSGSWLGYERLVNVADPKSNQLVFYLCESIISNPSFF